MKRALLAGSIALFVAAGWLWHAVNEPTPVSPSTHAETWVPATTTPITATTIRGETITVPAIRGAPARKVPPSRPGLLPSTRLLPGQHDGIEAPLPGS